MQHTKQVYVYATKLCCNTYNWRIHAVFISSGLDRHSSAVVPTSWTNQGVYGEWPLSYIVHRIIGFAFKTNPIPKHPHHSPNKTNGPSWTATQISTARHPRLNNQTKTVTKVWQTWSQSAGSSGIRGAGRGAQANDTCWRRRAPDRSATCLSRPATPLPPTKQPQPPTQTQTPARTDA